MGIKNFNKLLKDYVPKDMKEYNLNHYSDKLIAIDSSLILYQYISALRTSGKDLTDDNNKTTSHIFAILQNLIYFISKGVKPIYVFDGKAPELKKETLEKRKQDKEKANEKKKLSKTKEEEIKYFKRSLYITKEQYDECKIILKMLGVPYIQAEGEADVACSYLVRNNIAYAAYSEDMDFLTFGCPILLKKQKGNKIIELRLEKILKSLDIDYISFINLTVLLGCDYAPTIKGIGYKTAVKIIKENKDIESFLKKDKKYKIPNNYEYQKVIDYYLNPKIKLEKEYKYQEPKLDKIKELLEKKCFQDDVIKKYIKKFQNYLHYH